MKKKGSLIWLCIFFSSVCVSANELSLALNWKAEPEFGGFYLGQQEGLYKKNKINLKIIEGGSGTPTIQMLIAGKVDYAIVSAEELVLSHSRGASDVVALFAVYQSSPQGIMVHQESGFKSIEDIFKSDGILQLQQGLPFVQFLQKKYSPTKVKIVPYAGGVSAFLHDKKVAQQCYITAEPISAEKLGAKPQVFLISESGFNPYLTVLVTKSSRLKKNPDEVRSFVTATREAWKKYLADPTATNLFMSKLNKAMDLETFKKSAEAQIKLIENSETAKNGLGTMNIERWKTLIQQMQGLGLVKEKLNANDLFVNL